MKIWNFVTGAFQVNTLIVPLKDKYVFVVDPGGDILSISQFLASQELVPVAIVCTHGHFDHILSLDTLREKTGVPAYIHHEDAIMLTDGKKNAFYELFNRERSYRPAEILFSDGDRIPIGTKKLTVYHTPGHTHGSVCFLSDGLIFSGDTIFAETYGRCDLWNGDITKMRESLKKLSNLDRSLTLYAGHGPSCTLGEALNNLCI